MATRTFDQAFRMLEIVREKKTPGEQLQRLYDFGLFIDVLDANLEGFTPEKRDQIRGLLGLKPLLPEPVWKKVSDTAINVNLGASPRLPFSGAQIESHVGTEWAPVEKRQDGLYVDGRKVIFHLSERQLNGKTVKGYELRDELTNKPVLNANILDALYDNPHLIPKDWKKDEKSNIRYIFFWRTVFRDTDGKLYVTYLYFDDRSWYRGYHWLGSDWDSGNPSAVLAGPSVLVP